MEISLRYNIILTKQIMRSKNLMGLHIIFLKVLQSSKIYFSYWNKI